MTAADGWLPDLAVQRITTPIGHTVTTPYSVMCVANPLSESCAAGRQAKWETGLTGRISWHLQV